MMKFENDDFWESTVIDSKKKLKQTNLIWRKGQINGQSLDYN